MVNRLTLLLVGLLVVCPSVGWAQAQLTGSDLTRMSTPNYLEKQLFRCDISGSITGDGVIGGEASGVCSSGDWTTPTDCRGKNTLRAMFHEYGTGSGEAKIWNCLSVQPATGYLPGTNDGASVPGTEAPGVPGGPTDPDPLCTDLTAAAGVTLDGTTTTLMQLSDQTLGFIVGELQDCTNNCDSTLVVSCGR